MRMTKIVRTAADLLYPFCLIFGLYVVSHGHLTPGGGFQGGAVMATATALLIAAHRLDDASSRASINSMKMFEAIGLLGFLLAAGTALFFAGAFFQNWTANRPGRLLGDAVSFGANPGNLNTAGLLPWMNLAVGLEVFGALTVIILCMALGSREKAS